MFPLGLLHYAILSASHRYLLGVVVVIPLALAQVIPLALAQAIPPLAQVIPPLVSRSSAIIRVMTDHDEKTPLPAAMSPPVLASPTSAIRATGDPSHSHSGQGAATSASGTSSTAEPLTTTSATASATTDTAATYTTVPATHHNFRLLLTNGKRGDFLVDPRVCVTVGAVKQLVFERWPKGMPSYVTCVALLTLNSPFRHIRHTRMTSRLVG